ncbi:MAG TPA: sugar transferase, partial [Thermodesulfovibrionales bacterium]|nr:sugar transferase [Thermodesulfovibrionales bacterium]
MYTELFDRNTLPTMKPMSEFNSLVKQERYRSDRNNQKFTLITFDVTEDNGKLSNTLKFIDAFSSRLRTSDETGWLNDRQIAVLLPETTTEGAYKALINFSENSVTTDSLPRYNVYMYPSMNWNDKKDAIEQLLQADDVHEKFASGHRMPVWKRAIDIIGSSLGLLLLSPVLLFVAALIKIVSQGSVFFKQERIGRSGKVFTLFKFRTMKENNDATVHR